MSLWYYLCEVTGLEMLEWTFMRNALLAVLLMGPIFGLCSTMIVSGKMSFFSDALGHSAFTGIAIGSFCSFVGPIWMAVLFSIGIALLFSWVRSRSKQASDTIIGVFSSTAVALGIFVATLGGGSFTKYNAYLVGDILTVTASEILMLFLILAGILVFYYLLGNKLTVINIYPQLASSRAFPVAAIQTAFTVIIAIVVTLSISWVGLLIVNSLLVLPAASARNVSRNLRQYCLFSVLFALLSGVAGLVISYYLGCSAGAAICLALAVVFTITFVFRKK